MNKLLYSSLLLFSCGKPSDVSITQDMQVQVKQCINNSMPGSVRYKYIYSTESCTTDCHVAESKQDYCDYLRNEALNHYCAKGERQKALKEAKCERD